MILRETLLEWEVESRTRAMTMQPRRERPFGGDAPGGVMNRKPFAGARE
ncbi:hypothetical protein ACE3MS_17515 [Paenibacillus dendritiformis]